MEWFNYPQECMCCQQEKAQTLKWLFKSNLPFYIVNINSKWFYISDKDNDTYKFIPVCLTEIFRTVTNIQAVMTLKQSKELCKKLCI